jgi:hypothetical protein
MNDDIDLVIDPEVESRLRRISRDPEPQVPSRLYRHVEHVAGAHRPELAGVPLERLAGPRLLPMPRRRTLAGLAAALVLAVAGSALLIAIHPNKVATTPGPATWPWTALEWTDITSTAFPVSNTTVDMSEAMSITMIPWKGRLFANPEAVLWSSADGTHWAKVDGAPQMTVLRSTKDWLLAITSCWSLACSDPGPAVRYSTDGVTWKPSEFPTSLGISEVATTGDRAILLVTSPPSADPFPKQTGTIYVSTDGVTWQVDKDSVPADMAGALWMSIGSTRAGFIASGMVADPNGTETMTQTDENGTQTWTGSERSWFSADGVSWAPIDAATYRYGNNVYQGKLGDADPSGAMHSFDGLRWQHDEEIPPGLSGATASSNGEEILAQGDGPSFLVSQGDGQWQTLQSGGDIESLPQGGLSWAVPGGVIYDGGGRVFYGRALSGVTFTRTLAPGPTVLRPTDQIVPMPMPSLGPLPSVSLSPAVEWSKLAGLVKLPTGPIGATSVAAWSKGYVAVRNSDSLTGRVVLWTSADGKSWTPVQGSRITGQSANVAAAGDSVVVATWGSLSNGVWTSTDGATWTPASAGNPPIGDKPMAGDARGMVAAADDPFSQLVYVGSGGDTWYASTVYPGRTDAVNSIALSGSDFVAVGGMPDGNGVGIFPTAWTSSDAIDWSPSSIAAQPGQTFISIVAGREGFLAKMAAAEGGGPATLWSSPDGRTWQQLEPGAGPGASATFVGDGTHIVACQVDSGSLHCWSSLDGTAWTALAIGGDTRDLTADGSSVRVFPLRDGVLFVTDSGAWYAQALMR